jgi:hypothetical protein
MLYKGPDPECGISFNGVDILQLDPSQVKAAIASLPKDQRKLVKDLIRSRLDTPPEGYAKEYGRPSLKDVPYMRSENDGYPYLGGGHSPNCDGVLDYKENIYTKRKICWCMWASKATSGRRTEKLWKDYDNRVGLWKNDTKI